MKDGRVFTASDLTLRGIVVFAGSLIFNRGVGSDDGGVWTCRAENEMGAAAADFRITVKCGFNIIL